MSNRFIYLQEDPSQSLVENKILGEVHHPAAGKARLIVPNWGAFYENSLKVYDVDDLTQTPIDPSHYAMGDSFVIGNERSGKATYTCFILLETAPVSVRIDYDGYGGFQSRSAHEVIDWYNERLNIPRPTINYDELTDLPKEWNPIHHLHLLAHVYGMEYITNEMKRIEWMIANTSRLEILEQNYQEVKLRIDRLYAQVNMTVDSIVNDSWETFIASMNAYNLGVDLLKNYPVLGSRGALAASPAFAVPHPEDERYVDLEGLGSFSKAYVDRVLERSTGLGMKDALIRDAQRGSFIGATIGDTFTLPSPAEARAQVYTNPKIYPPNWVDTDRMVVIKIAGNTNNLGGIFSLFNERTADQWYLIIFNDSRHTPFEFGRVYYDDSQLPLADMVAEHIKLRGAVHQETKEQIGLGLVENLPVVDIDNIVTDESKRMYMTVDAMMADLRVNAEGIRLQRLENGQVDYDADLLDKVRIIINTGACPPDTPPKDQFVSSFCDGSDKWVRMTDGLGSTYDKISELNSDDCNYTERLGYGHKINEFCRGTTMMGRFADGLGGSYVEEQRINSVDCGYVASPPMGSVLSVYCQGVNQMTRYADGKGGTYDMVSMVDTYICGGKIYPSTGTGTGTGTPGDTSKATLKFSSTHKTLTPNTVEILSFYAEKLIANTAYFYEIMTSAPAINDGNPYIMDTGFFTTNSTGSYLWEQERLDDGVSTKRGAYKTYVTLPSANLTSNTIDRNFINGDTPTKPDDDTNAGGGNPGGGGTSEGGGSDTNVDGDPYNPPDGDWPPVAVYKPNLTLSTDKTTINIGSTETLTTEFLGFYAGREYEIAYWFSNPDFNNGAPTYAGLTVTITTGPSGKYVYRLPQEDTGASPRGLTDTWVVVTLTTGDKLQSNIVKRLFTNQMEGPSLQRLLKITTSHDNVYIGTVFTQTIVLSGASPNTDFTIELRRSFYSADREEGQYLVATTNVTTNGSGIAKVEITDAYNGFSPPPGRIYNFYARLKGIATQASNVSSVNFVDRPANQTGTGKITIAATPDIIKKGVSEVITVTISGAPPGDQVFDLRVKSSSYNGGIAAVMYSGTINVGSTGMGVAEVRPDPDDGVTMNRGSYETWATCPKLILISAPITRFFVSDGTGPGSGDPNAQMQLSYTTNPTILSYGMEEKHTVEINRGIPNATVSVGLYIQSEALNNGNTPLRTDAEIKLNSQGYGLLQFTKRDPGPPELARGNYLTWAKASTGAESMPFVRYFVGTAPPAVVYNPKAVYRVTTTVIRVGETDTNVVELTGFTPNKAYTVVFWFQGLNAFNGVATVAANELRTTDANGRATVDLSSPYNGAPAPGTYDVWAVVSETNTRTDRMQKTYAVATQPPAPVYNPALTYTTNRSEIRAGQTETHFLRLSGMRPNTTYYVTTYFSSPSLAGNRTFNNDPVRIDTNADGVGSNTFATTDPGAPSLPRGSYRTWGIIDGLGVSSPVFTRIFV